MKKIKFILALLLMSGTAFSQVDLPSLFGDYMVLQQNFQAPVWGWADAGTRIEVQGSWDNQLIDTKADDQGDWMLRINTPEAGGPYFIKINDDTLHNVMIGEVWVCSGQSNTQWALNQTDNAEMAIDQADYPDIRLFYVARDNADEPGKDCYGKWEACTPESATTFSAVAYYFGKELHQELDVPVGLIHTSWGGSTAEAWINNEVLKSTPEGQYYLELYRERVESMAPGINPRNHQSPSSTYNGMLKPIIPFGIRGAIWYQGESNVETHEMYRNLKDIMISNWRNEWGVGDFPFYYVQLAPFYYQQKIIGGALRDAQRRALDIPNTGMAVTLDIGDPDDIHPTNKKDVGKRLSLWALAKTYGRTEIIYSGPLYKSMEIEGNKIRIYFDHFGGGLKCKGGQLTHFTMAGEDKVFYTANASIDGNTILVSSPEVKKPMSVRFAFDNEDEPNLFNEEGLPASTFRTDNWNIITAIPSIEAEYSVELDIFIITMKSRSGEEIRYTLDGSEPQINSNRYVSQFSVSEDVLIKAKIFEEGEASMSTNKTYIEKHLGLGKSVVYQELYNSNYTGGGEQALVNGVFGSEMYYDGKWQGFNGKDVEIVVDLGNITMLSRISINFLLAQQSWIMLPEKVVFYGSNDGSNFELIGEDYNDIPLNKKEATIGKFEINIDHKYRYIKIFTTKVILPEWHPGAGRDGWLFTDEIVIK